MTRKLVSPASFLALVYRTIIEGQMVKKVALTQGKFALVDDDIFEELNQHKWYARKSGKTFYAIRNLPRINGKQYKIAMHHKIMGKPSKGFEIDHRNGRGYDNQRHNLRFVTSRQNGQNLKNIKKTSQYSGVSWAKHIQKWIASIKINGKTRHLGCFKNEFVAFCTYKHAVESIGEKVIGDRL